MRPAGLAFQAAVVDASGDWAGAASDFSHRILHVHPDFGDVIQPFFPPLMVDGSADEAFAALVQRLAGVFSSFLARIFERDGIEPTLAALGYRPDERALLAEYCTAPWLAQAGALLRFDFLCVQEGLKAVELNAAPGIGGIGLIEGYDEAFAASDYRAWMESQGFDVSSIHPLDHAAALIRRLVGAGRHGAALRDGCEVHVALVTMPSDLAYLQTQVCARYLQRPGLRVTVASVFDLQIDEAGVRIGGQPVQLVWAVHAFEAEIIHAALRAQASALRRAAAEGVVAYLVPPGASVLGNKALFSLLLGEPGHSLLAPEDRSLIDHTLPWTAIVRQDNIDRLVLEQHSMVLKPARGVSGQGMLFGPQVGPVAWRLGLERIIASGVVYVAQRLCHSVACDVPPGSFETGQVKLVLGGICVGGRYAGHFVRALAAHSSKPINVSFGGRMAPCYVLRKSAQPGRS